MPVENPCLFDNSTDCPATAEPKSGFALNLINIVDKACPICPIRLKMLPK